MSRVEEVSSAPNRFTLFVSKAGVLAKEVTDKNARKRVEPRAEPTEMAGPSTAPASSSSYLLLVNDFNWLLTLAGVRAPGWLVFSFCLTFSKLHQFLVRGVWRVTSHVRSLVEWPLPTSLTGPDVADRILETQQLS